MTVIENKTYDEERALYGSRHLAVKHCAFDGPADGESAFKESADITAIDCFFNLRYPFWHVHGLRISGCEMTPLCRAALWYSDGILIEDTKLHGIKALRECSDVTMKNCDIISPEFGWSSNRVRMCGVSAESEYFMLRAQKLEFTDVSMKGKYSFQYISDSQFENCRFDTKDAFWHAHNVTVKNSVVNGEYLAWYSDGLTLENCVITGTQPLCYCKNLTLINCKMHDADLCFEKSDVNAEITTDLISIKNPASGRIVVPAVGEIIRNDPHSVCKVFVRPVASTR